MPTLAAILDAYAGHDDVERRDVARIRALPGSAVWRRSSALHVTGSAVVVHPQTTRVLLRWHERMESWLQVGGHADADESDPHAIACREAREETGLDDLTPYPGPGPELVHVVVVPVPGGKGEPPHEHADLRFVLATRDPDAAVAERASAPVRWFTFAEACAAAAEDNLLVTLERVYALLASRP
jgi:8-oxo-dGTP pyrophosphatase MutT (NUDIX family)